MRAAGLMWTALIIGVGVSLFVLKYKVQALEDELHAKEQRVERDRTAIRVLEAEWAYLNDPERLARLSAEHFGFAPPTPSQVAKIETLPVRATDPSAPSTAAPVEPALSGHQADMPAADTAPPRSAARGSVPPHADSAADVTAMPVALPAHQRPSLILATVARLQRLIPSGWAGATIEAEARP
ncbi:MAG: hypothetical protein SFV21_04800 [Rhodospirillaceae bacterium]|nr:hypothetical protein [Rhodospirillaceae bacterium]